MLGSAFQWNCFVLLTGNSDSLASYHVISKHMRSYQTFCVPVPHGDMQTTQNHLGAGVQRAGFPANLPWAEPRPEQLPSLV